MYSLWLCVRLFYVCVCTGMCECNVCMRVCTYARVCACKYWCNACMRIYAWMYAYMCECLHVIMYIRMYAYMYVCTYVRMYTRTCICTMRARMYTRTCIGTMCARMSWIVTCLSKKHVIHLLLIFLHGGNGCQRNASLHTILACMCMYVCTYVIFCVQVWCMSLDVERSACYEEQVLWIP